MSWLKDLQKNTVGALGAGVGLVSSLVISPVVIAAELIDGKSIEEAVNSAGTTISQVTNDVAQFGYDHGEDIVEVAGAVLSVAKEIHDATKPKPPNG